METQFMMDIDVLYLFANILNSQLLWGHFVLLLYCLKKTTGNTSGHHKDFVHLAFIGWGHWAGDEDVFSSEEKSGY